MLCNLMILLFLQCIALVSLIQNVSFKIKPVFNSTMSPNPEMIVIIFITRIISCQVIAVFVVSPKSVAAPRLSLKKISVKWKDSKNCSKISGKKTKKTS